MKYLFLTIIIISTTAAIGCKSTTSVEGSTLLVNQSGNVLMPLAIGNTWHYQVTQFDTTGAIISTSLDTIFVMGSGVYNVMGSDIYNGDSIYSVSLPASFWPHELAYTNKTDGLWEYRVGEALFYYHLSIPYPTTKNTVYNPYSDNEYTVVLQNADTTITTPAGTFHALKYQVNNFGIKIFYYAVGIGLVFEEDYSSKKILLDYKVH